MANSVVAQLLHLEAENMEKPITVYINSPGGSVTAGMAIYDTMQVRRRCLLEEMDSVLSFVCLCLCASVSLGLVCSCAFGSVCVL